MTIFEDAFKNVETWSMVIKGEKIGLVLCWVGRVQRMWHYIRFNITVLIFIRLYPLEFTFEAGKYVNLLLKKNWEYWNVISSSITTLLYLNFPLLKAVLQEIIQEYITFAFTAFTDRNLVPLSKEKVTWC